MCFLRGKSFTEEKIVYKWFKERFDLIALKSLLKIMLQNLKEIDFFRPFLTFYSLAHFAPFFIENFTHSINVLTWIDSQIYDII